jgi:hypothetical protein
MPRRPGSRNSSQLWAADSALKALSAVTGLRAVLRARYGLAIRVRDERQSPLVSGLSAKAPTTLPDSSDVVSRLHRRD